MEKKELCASPDPAKCANFKKKRGLKLKFKLPKLGSDKKKPVKVEDYGRHMNMRDLSSEPGQTKIPQSNSKSGSTGLDEIRGARYNKLSAKAKKVEDAANDNQPREKKMLSFKKRNKSTY